MRDDEPRRLATRLVERLRSSKRKSPGAPGRITAVDLDGEMLRIAQSLRRGGKTKITRLAAESLPAKEGPDLENPLASGTWLAGALTRLKVKPGPVVMGVPRRKVVLKPLTLPAAADIDELASMVHYQVGKDLPFDPADAVIDFTLQSHFASTRPGAVGGDENGADATQAAAAATGQSAAQVEVLVAAVRREVVEHYRAEAAAAGLKLHALGLRSYANVRCVELCDVYRGSEGVALVYLRPDEVIIDVLVGKTLAFSRSVSLSITRAGNGEPRVADGLVETAADIPSSTPDGKEELVEALATEVARNLRSFEGMERHARVAMVVVSGDTGVEGAMASELAGRLEIPCELLDPAVRLGLTGADARHAPAAISAIGLAVGASDPDGLPFDFLHPKRPPARRDRGMRRKLLVAGVVLAALLAGASVLEKTFERKRSEHDALTARIQALEKRRGAFKRRIAHARTVDSWLADDRRWLDHWLYLSKVLPPCTDIYLSRITTGAGGVIRLSLHARSGDVLASLDRGLRDAGYEARPLAVTPSKDRYGYDFKTTVELRVPDGMAMEPGAVESPSRPPDDASGETALTYPEPTPAAPAVDDAFPEPLGADS